MFFALIIVTAMIVFMVVS